MLFLQQQHHQSRLCLLPQSMSGEALSILQVRQHTGHKRTFFYLEQLILKFSADQQCINIKEMHEVGKHSQTFQLG